MILKNLLYGLFIGIGFIVPGVSGGVLATILGIYDKIINTLTHFGKDIKKNILFILPLIIGIIISVLLFSKLILFLLEERQEFISYVFIGLIIGCLPYLLKEIKIKTQKTIMLIPFILSLLLGIILYIVGENLETEMIYPSNFIMLIAGVFYAIGKIVPGISGSALLMLLGIYKYFLNIIANPKLFNLHILFKFIPFIISFILSGIVLIKIMDILLKKHFRITYSVIIGFVISSILFIYPHCFSFAYLIIAFLSFLISYELSK